MKRLIAGGLLAAATLLGGIALTPNTVSATKPDSEGEHKVWVCHATAGLGELKNGYDLIEVDIASTRGQAHLAHATTDPKNNSKFGVLYDKIDVGEDSDCGGVPTKDDKVTYGEWTGEPECDAKTYIQTRTVTTISYTWDGEEFVASDPVVTEEKREVKVEEVEPCPTTPTTEPPETTQPPTTQPETTQPATTQPATTQPSAVATTTPPPPPAATTPPPAAVGQQLPSTGNETTIMALIAGLLTMAGVGGVTLARRR